MSKANVVVPKVPSAKILARYQDRFARLQVTPEKMHAYLDKLHEVYPMTSMNIEMNPETKAMLLESARVHDEMEDRSDRLAQAALDELSPHARAALNRLLGTPHDPE